MTIPLNLNSPNAALIELALQCESVDEFCVKLGLAPKGGSNTRARTRLLSLNFAFGWLNPPVIPASNRGRSDIIYAPYQNEDGHIIKAYEARPINRQTLQEEFLGVFTSFSKAQQAIALACPQRAKTLSPDELIKTKTISLSLGDNKLSKINNKKHVNLFTDPDKLKLVVAKSRSFSEAVSHYSASVSGSNIATLKNRIAKLNISTSHFSAREKLVFNTPDDVLKLNSGACNKTVRKIILANKLLAYICGVEQCKQGPMRFGKPLTLQLEHKNGNRNDHRLCNLEFLCPSCHSQTLTFGSKNAGKYSHIPTTAQILKKAENIDNRPTRANLIAEQIGIQFFKDAIANKRSLRDLASELKASNLTIMKLFAYWDLKFIPAPTPMSRAKELSKQELNRRFSQGETLRAIGREFNCSDNTIKKRARLVGANFSLRPSKLGCKR